MTGKKKKVCGIGINDADYPVHICAMIDGRCKILWVCPFYRAWAGMLKRCYSAKCRPKHPTYAGCSVATEWHSFSIFRAWMVGQSWEGKHLDKDILRPGNSVYSPTVCVLVSKDLNTFFTDAGAARGKWPIGVSLDKATGRFRATCSNPGTGKQEHLGMFAAQESAHEAWRERKHQHACKYADQQTDQRIAQALRSRYAILTGETR